MSDHGTILAVLAGSSGDAAVLEAAGRLAASSGLVRVLAVRSDPVRVLPIVGEAGAAAAAELMSILEEQSKERAARARANFDAWRGTSGIAVEFLEMLGHPSETAAAAARNSDIVVVARPRDVDEPMAGSLVEACLFGSGRPVLIVPSTAPSGFAEAIAVLWDGSRTAARALGDALPLLARARSVLVLTAGAPADEAPTGEAVADRLRARGIAASARTLSVADREGAALLAAASGAGCDFLVMGGFGHSRVREMILGGVTRHMLAAAPVPILMSH